MCDCLHHAIHLSPCVIHNLGLVNYILSRCHWALIVLVFMMRSTLRSLDAVIDVDLPV